MSDTGADTEELQSIDVLFSSTGWHRLLRRRRRWSVASVT
jgi:hypothetical protein